MDGVYKLTAGEAAKIAASVNTNPKVVQWRTKRITVRPMLGFPETIQFVNNVMNACIDRNTGYFIPETLDYAFRVNLVSMYACVELPEDTNLQYVLLYSTDLYDVILNAVNNCQIEAIRNAINICSEALARQNKV